MATVEYLYVRVEGNLNMRLARKYKGELALFSKVKWSTSTSKVKRLA